jgi:hypothetical protein
MTPGFRLVDELTARYIDFDLCQPASSLLCSRERLSDAASVNKLTRPVLRRAAIDRTDWQRQA